VVNSLTPLTLGASVLHQEHALEIQNAPVEEDALNLLVFARLDLPEVSANGRRSKLMFSKDSSMQLTGKSG
jgi:hypothetical protein